MLENARKRLRLLVKLIKRRAAQTDTILTFKDEMGDEEEVAFDAFATRGRFRTIPIQSTKVPLRENENHIAIHKLRMNEPLTDADLQELNRMLRESGIGDAEKIERRTRRKTKVWDCSFVSLVGHYRAAQRRHSLFLFDGKSLNANQLKVTDLVINHLTHRGVVKIEALYSSPYGEYAVRKVPTAYLNPKKSTNS